MYIVPNLEFQEQTLKWYEKKYEVEIIRIPHFETSNFFRYGTFRNADLEVPIISIKDVYEYLRANTGIEWIAAGERISDSIVRRAMIKHTGSVDKKRGRFFPISHWLKKDIIDYIKFHKLKVGNDSKKLGFSFRSLSGAELSMVKSKFPNDYKKIISLYPFAESAVERYEKYGKEQIPEL